LKIFAIISTLFFSVAALAVQPQLPAGNEKWLGAIVVYRSPSVVQVKGPGRATYFKANGIVQWGTQAYQTGVLQYICEPNGTDCELDKFEAKKSYQQCQMTKNQRPACRGLQRGSGNAASNNHSSNGRNGAFEEHDSRTTPGYSTGNDSSSGAFDERSSHHVDQPRESGNEIDGWAAPF
jgi:hypothetical protein